jgi:uncharacterized protein (DUF3084 family)
MKERLEDRLNELRQEFESGQKMLADLENQRTNLQQTVLRISGAIQVLEELLGSEESNSGKRTEAGNTHGIPVSDLETEARQ